MASRDSVYIFVPFTLDSIPPSADSIPPAVDSIHGYAVIKTKRNKRADCSASANLRFAKAHSAQELGLLKHTRSITGRS